MSWESKSLRGFGEFGAITKSVLKGSLAVSRWNSATPSVRKLSTTCRTVFILYFWAGVTFSPYRRDFSVFSPLHGDFPVFLSASG